MTRPGGDASRSGDPRKRAIQSPPPATSARLAAAVGALVVAAVIVVFVAIESRPDDPGPSTVAKDHAEAACELTSKAQEAAGADIEARAGVAALILDRAMLESARAAELAPEFADLDEAVQAAHAGGGGPLQDSFDAALATCRDVTG